MEELIKIEKSADGKSIVKSAREIYEFLGLEKAHWVRWYKKNIINNKFAVEKQDYIGFTIMVNGNETQDFALSLDLAKKLSMLTRTEKGEMVRDYFLECERRSLNPYLGLTKSEALKLAYEAELRAEQAEKKVLLLEKDNTKLQSENKEHREYLNRIFKSRKHIDVGQAAKLLDLGYGRNTLYEKLRELGMVLKGKREPIQKYVKSGHLALGLKIDENHTDEYFALTLVSQKGLYLIAKKLNAGFRQTELMLEAA